MLPPLATLAMGVSARIHSGLFPASTLFLAVGAQHDLWPGGAWPLVDADQARAVVELVALAAALDVRMGGICCAHVAGDPIAPGAPPHCLAGTRGAAHPPGCVPVRPVVVVGADAVVPTLDRAHAYYISSGCAEPIDATPPQRIVFDHLVAGVRDAVVFGTAVEHALAHTVDALLRRRVRTHVVLDASAAVDASEAQRVVAGWKRRGVDGATAGTIARLLGRAAAP